MNCSRSDQFLPTTDATEASASELPCCYDNRPFCPIRIPSWSRRPISEQYRLTEAQKQASTFVRPALRLFHIRADTRTSHQVGSEEGWGAGEGVSVTRLRGSGSQGRRYRVDCGGHVHPTFPDVVPNSDGTPVSFCGGSVTPVDKIRRMRQICCRASVGYPKTERFSSSGGIAPRSAVQGLCHSTPLRAPPRIPAICSTCVSTPHF